MGHLAEPPLHFPTELVIDQQLVCGEGTEEAILDPATGELLCTVREASPKQVVRAVLAASRAWESWSQTTPVLEIMTHNPQFVAPETTVSDAVLIMQRHNFRHLPIVSPASKILGVFSLRDAMARELVQAEQMADLIDQQLTNVLS